MHNEFREKSSSDYYQRTFDTIQITNHVEWHSRSALRHEIIHLHRQEQLNTPQVASDSGLATPCAICDAAYTAGSSAYTQQATSSSIAAGDVVKAHSRCNAAAPRILVTSIISSHKRKGRRNTASQTKQKGIMGKHRTMSPSYKMGRSFSGSK